MSSARPIAVSALGRKLYSKNSGTWSEFSPTPSLGDNYGQACIALPNGGIIIPDNTVFRHYDPTTNTWSTKSPPSTLSALATSYWVLNDGTVFAGYNLNLMKWDGASWTKIAMTGVSGTTVGGIVAFSSTDVWYTTRSRNLWHWDGATWTDYWTAANTASGLGDICFCCAPTAIGSTLYVYCWIVSNFCVLKYSGGTWTTLGGLVSGGFDQPAGIWGAAETGLMVWGSNSYHDKIRRWSGSAWDLKHTATNYDLNAGSSQHIIQGDGAGNVWACHGGVHNCIHESADDGLTWSENTWIDANMIDAVDYQAATSVSTSSTLGYGVTVGMVQGSSLGHHLDVSLVEYSARQNLGFSVNVGQCDFIDTPKPQVAWNEFDEHAAVLSLTRLPGEDNATLKHRSLLRLSGVTNSTYNGLVTAITRDLGLDFYSALEIDARTDSNGKFLAPDPRIIVSGEWIYLYSDYANELLDYQINRIQKGGNYETLGRLADFINSTVFFMASVPSTSDRSLRSMTLLEQSNAVDVDYELIPCSTRFRLEHQKIVPGTIFFGDKVTFKTAVTSEVLCLSTGDYYIDHDTGIVTVYNIPCQGTFVRYEYYRYPNILLGSPIILYPIVNQDVFLFDPDTGLPTPEGVDIINELNSVGGGLYWGS